MICVGHGIEGKRILREKTGDCFSASTNAVKLFLARGKEISHVTPDATI